MENQILIVLQKLNERLDSMESNFDDLKQDIQELKYGQKEANIRLDMMNINNL